MKIAAVRKISLLAVGAVLSTSTVFAAGAAKIAPRVYDGAKAHEARFEELLKQNIKGLEQNGVKAEDIAKYERVAREAMKGVDARDLGAINKALTAGQRAVTESAKVEATKTESSDAAKATVLNIVGSRQNFGKPKGLVESCTMAAGTRSSVGNSTGFVAPTIEGALVKHLGESRTEAVSLQVEMVDILQLGSKDPLSKERAAERAKAAEVAAIVIDAGGENIAEGTLTETLTTQADVAAGLTMLYDARNAEIKKMLTTESGKAKIDALKKKLEGKDYDVNLANLGEREIDTAALKPLRDMDPRAEREFVENGCGKATGATIGSAV